MTWVILAFFSHLVFIPGIYDGFSLPKRVYVIGLGCAAAVYLLRRAKPLPLFDSVYLYASIIMLGIFAPTNFYFAERIALDFSDFLIFWAVATTPFTKREIKLLSLGACFTLVVAYAFRVFLPSNEGMLAGLGDFSYFAYLAILAAPLSIIAAGSYGYVFVVGPAFTLFLSLESRASSAAIIWLLIYFGASYGNLARAKTLAIVTLLAPATIFVTVALFQPFQIDDVRVAIWKNSIPMSRDAGLLGFGRGQFEFNYPKYANAKVRDLSLPAMHHGHPHNEFVNQLIETGFLGTAAFFAIIARIFLNMSAATLMPLSIAASLVGVVLYSSFWFPFLHPSMSVTFWALAGVLWSVSKNDGRQF